MLLMVPALFGVSVSQINLLLDTVLASFLQTGSVSWLYYADRLSELPLGAFGIAIGTVILPSLSRQHAGEDPKAFSATLDWALRMVLLVGVPAALALGILAEPMIASLFYYGAMSEEAVVQSARALQAYSLGVLAFMLIKVLAPGFFARQDLKTPVRVAVICMVANMVMNLILIWPLQHVGLALATSLSSMLNAVLLFWGLYKIGVYRPAPGWWLFGLRLAAACAAMVAVVWWLNVPAQEWFQWGWQQRAAAGPVGLRRPGGICRWAVADGVATATFAALIATVRPMQTCPLTMSHAYNRPLFKQEVRYAAGSRSSQPAPPTSGLRRHHRQFRRRAPGHQAILALARTCGRAGAAELRGDLRAATA